MVDIVTPAKRSEMMSGIRARDTKPEILVRKHLHGLGFRFRLDKKICGISPDIVLPMWRICIFVHGCFWHRHKGCSIAYMPKTNTGKWKQKFDENVRRDRNTIKVLHAEGWACGVIWECSVRSSGFRKIDYRKLIATGDSWEIPVPR